MRIGGEVVSSDHKMTVADKGEGVTYLSKSVVEFFKYKVCLRMFTSMYFSLSGMLPKIRSFRPISPYLHNL